MERGTGHLGIPPPLALAQAFGEGSMPQQPLGMQEAPGSSPGSSRSKDQTGGDTKTSAGNPGALLPI